MTAAMWQQKNYSVVRRYAGYSRYDRDEEIEVLKELYERLRLYINFFQPVMKQISKERIGSRIIKKYDIPKTPYQRILQASSVSDAIKEELRKQYGELNPAELHRQILNLQNKLIDMITLKNRLRKSFKINYQTNSNSCYNFV